MDIPDELLYSKENIWVRVDGGKAFIGVTDFYQEEIGAISAVELPEEGDEIEQDDSIGSLDAKKTVAEIYAPISGTVLSVNHEVVDNPALINDDPYDDGWLIEVELADSEELKALISAEDYEEHCENCD